MRFNLTILSLLAALVLLSSCEKVIDVDLNTAEKKYVIEAIITDQEQTAKVIVTQTKNFDEDNDYPGVRNAIVEVTEAGGSTVVFPEQVPGIYSLTSYKGTPGKSYSLKITVGGQVFTATSVMPTRVGIDSIFVTDEFLFSETRKIVNVSFHDPVGRGNNYRYIQFVNGNKETQILVQNDDYLDGRDVTAKLFFFADDDEEVRQIKSGDVVKIDFQCLDAANYKFWYSLFRGSTGGSQSGTPSNPVSNIQGGALGYFSAHTLDTKTLIVP